MGIKLKYEDAVRTIREIVAGAETDFRKENGRFPSLVDELDYLLLGNNFSIREICQGYGEAEDGGEIIPADDVARVLMRNYLERESFFQDLGDENRINAFNGFVGVLDYHAPEREYRMRIDALNRLRQASEDLPKDFSELVRCVEDISKKCFIKSLYNTESRKKAFDNIGTFLVNPSAHLHMWLSGRGGNSFESLIKFWEEFAENAKEYPSSRSYE